MTSEERIDWISEVAANIAATIVAHDVAWTNPEVIEELAIRSYHVAVALMERRVLLMEVAREADAEIPFQKKGPGVGGETGSNVCPGPWKPDIGVD